jgi:hypothetical protein
MARDHRILQNGQRIDYTCKNWSFSTDIAKGRPHGQHPTLGSVFDEPLAGSQAPGEYSLWLEHVIANADPNDECYWLMWYQDGRPTIPLSGILHREDIANMQRLLASFIP